MSLHKDQLIEGKEKSYRLLHPLGEGGMSKVWLAINPRTDEQFAVKEASLFASGEGTNFHTNDRAKALESLKHQAQILSQLQHTNLPKFIEGIQVPLAIEIFLKKHILQSLRRHTAQIEIVADWDPFLKEVRATPDFVRFVEQIPTHLDMEALFFEIEKGHALDEFVGWRQAHSDPETTLEYIQTGPEYYLVTEYAPGDDLYAIMSGRQWVPLLQEQVIPWIHQVMSALDYLHTRNKVIIHRDIKPSNIVVDENNKVYLLDFGIAEVLTAQEKFAAWSPNYRAPEQIPESQQAQDVRTDIYSLGATMYALLTGLEPWDAQDRKNGRRLFAPNHLNPDLSKIVVDAILRAMELNPEDRFQSIADMQRALNLDRRYQNGLDARKVGHWRIAQQELESAKVHADNLWQASQIEVELDFVKSKMEEDKQDLECRVQEARKAYNEKRLILARSFLNNIVARESIYERKAALLEAPRNLLEAINQDLLKSKVVLPNGKPREGKIHIRCLCEDEAIPVRIVADTANFLYVLWNTGDVQAYDPTGKLWFSTMLYDSPAMLNLPVYDLCVTQDNDHPGCYVLAQKWGEPNPTLTYISDKCEMTVRTEIKLVPGITKVARLDGHLYFTGKIEGEPHPYLYEIQSHKLVARKLSECQNIQTILADKGRLFIVDRPKADEEILFCYYRHEPDETKKLRKWLSVRGDIRIAGGASASGDIYVFSRPSEGEQQKAKYERLNYDMHADGTALSKLPNNALQITSSHDRLYVLYTSGTTVYSYDPVALI